MDRRSLRPDQLLIKGLILLFVHWAVEVSVILALIVPGLGERLGQIYAAVGDNRRRRVKKAQRTPAQPRDFLRQSIAGQRTGSHDRRLLGVGQGKLRDLPRYHLNVFVTFYFSCDQAGKLIPVHRQSASGGNLGLVGAFHQQRVKAPHFLLQQAGGAFHPARFRRIGANQLRHILTVMSRRIFFRLHFIQGHLGAGIGRLPSGFTSRQAPAYYVNFHPGLPPVHSRILL